MARLLGEDAASGKAEHTGPNPKLSIFNLPDNMTEQIVRDLLGQFGKLRMVSLIRDLGTGKIKGYGIFEYENPNDVDLATIALNGFVCGQNVIRVQKLGGQAATTAPKSAPVAATAMANSMTQKIVSNPVLAMQVKQGREIGSSGNNRTQISSSRSHCDGKFHDAKDSFEPRFGDAGEAGARNRVKRQQPHPNQLQSQPLRWQIP